MRIIRPTFKNFHSVFSCFLLILCTKDTKREYILIETLLKCYGLWPHQSEIVRKTIFCMHHIITVSLIFALSAGLTEKWSTNVSVIYENIICISYFSGATIKYTILYIKRDQIKMLYDQFLSNCEEEVEDKETKLINAYIRKGRLINSMLLVYGFPAFILIGALSYYLSSYDSSENMFENHFPYYYDKMIISDRYHYTLIFLHMTVAFCSVTFCYFMTSAIFVGMTTHVCGLFTVACHRLKSATDIDDEELKASNSKLSKLKRNDKIISNLENVAVKHNEAIKIVHQIELTFSLVIGIVQINALSCFGITMYDVLCHTGTSRQLLRSIILLSIFILYVYILNWTGQEILNVCNAFLMSSYSIEWYKMPIEAKKLLMTIQQRANKSELLTAGSVFILSLHNFSWILQKSWSITAVLLSSQNKKS